MKNIAKKVQPKKTIKKTITSKMEKESLLINKYYAFLLDISKASKKEGIIYSTYIKKHKVSNSSFIVLYDNGYMNNNAQWTSLTKPSKKLASSLIELIREYNRIAKAKSIMIKEIITEDENKSSDLTIAEFKLKCHEYEHQLNKKLNEIEILRGLNSTLELEKIELSNNYSKLSYTDDDINKLKLELENAKKAYNSLNADFIKVCNDNSVKVVTCQTIENNYKKLDEKYQSIIMLLCNIKNSNWFKMLTLLDRTTYKTVLENVKLYFSNK